MNRRLISLLSTFPIAACGTVAPPPVQAPVAWATTSVRHEGPENDTSANQDVARTSCQYPALHDLTQGDSESEQRITASIRKLILRNDTLSYIAKKVSVRTTGNTVTLRGPVKRGVERTSIEMLAKQTDGVGFVDNQIEVRD